MSNTESQSKRRAATRRSVTGLLGLLIGAVLLLLGGCNRVNRIAEEHFNARFTRNEHGMLRVEKIPPQERLRNAVGSPNPDVRREAVVWLGKPKRRDQEAVVKLLGLVVTSDEDPTVRAAAARALGNSIRPEAVEPLIEALADESKFVRLEAATALTDRRNDNAKRALMVRLNTDDYAQVRAASARALSVFHERRVLDTLIEALKDRDFAVVYEAEQSLVRMTGFFHHFDPEQWNRWLAQLGTEGNPFAKAGRTPPNLQEGRVPWTTRFKEAAEKSWTWWQADEKVPE
jgi:hypothetical protein